MIFLALTKLKIGADFGLQNHDTKFNSYGRLLFPDQRNPRYLDDLLGLIIYETNPKPEFKLSPVSSRFETPSTKFDETINWAYNNYERVSIIKEQQ